MPNNTTNYAFRKQCPLPVESLQINEEEVKSFNKGADVRNSDQHSQTVNTHTLTHTFTHIQAKKN